MGKANIGYHSLRLNLDIEQHCRVHKILTGLNTDIHKSVNQFLIDAADFYIRSLNDEELVKGAGEQKKDKGYITKDDFNSIKEELKSEVKSEIIMLLGAALGGGAARVAEGGMGRMVVETVARETEEHRKEETVDPTMMELVDDWG